MNHLRRIYGRTDVLHVQLLDKLLEFENLRSGTDPRLRDFAISVETYVSSLKSLGMEEDLHNKHALCKLHRKLHEGNFVKWAEIQRRHPKKNLEDFAEFLTERMIVMKSLIPLPSEKPKQKEISSRGKMMTHQQVNDAENSGSGSDDEPEGYFHCKGKHRLFRCPLFTQLPVTERIKVVKEHGVCQACLNSKKHGRRKCEWQRACNVRGCTQHHNRLLHVDAPGTGANPSAPPFVPMMSHGSDNQILCKVVAVRVSGPTGEVVDTFAYLDDGSTMTLMEKSLFDRLHLRGERERLRLQWTKGITRDEDSFCTSLTLAGRNARSLTLMNVHTVEDLDMPLQSQDAKALKANYTHLKNIPIPNLVKAKPEIMIGLEHAKLLVGRRSVLGNDNEPIASKTPLGWIVYGKQRAQPHVVSLTHSSRRSTVYASMFHQSRSDGDLHELVRNHFTTENFGVMPPKRDLVSEDVETAQRIMDSTLKYKDGRYEVGLLWKSNDVKFPNSYPMALSRLVNLEKSLKKEPALLKWKNDHMKELVDKGYAHVAQPEELTWPWERIWYCPTFVVVNQNKVPPKPRDVADVAAKVGNVSLNTELLKGPDNMAPLQAGLFKMREQAIVVNADGKEMFHQVAIKKEDRQCQRMLWRVTRRCTFSTG